MLLFCLIFNYFHTKKQQKKSVVFFVFYAKMHTCTYFNWLLLNININKKLTKNILNYNIYYLAKKNWYAKIVIVVVGLC